MEQERTLTEPQRDEFEDMLRSLTLERSQIKEAMGFALDNADAAGEVILLYLPLLGSVGGTTYLCIVYSPMIWLCFGPLSTIW